jgi:membrane fusion protein, copper/silver efflux system
MSTLTKAISIVCVAAGSFVIGTWQRSAPGGPPILYYQDPMHPAYRSDRPGIAPDCGMQLEPVFAGSGGPGSSVKRKSIPAGVVEISPEKQQVIGIRTAVVTKGPGPQSLRVLGRVALDETRVYRVAAAVDGWIRSAGPITTVRKDEVLATFYNRDFLTAQQTYLYALNTMDRFQEQESAEQLKLTRNQMRAAEENLQFLGMGDAQLKHIAQDRQIAREIELRSPVNGVVLARNALPGLRFDRGAELFRVADLTHVWVLADLFGKEARHVRPGQGARIILQDQERSLVASVTDSLPQFDAISRTLKVRLELDNPGYVLRPDMFVDVEIPISLPAAVTVPADAVIDSGLKKTAFVVRGAGFFEPRSVEIAWRFGDRIGIARGIEPGERIVVSGNFLIDSESRMRLADAGSFASAQGVTAGKDPVCGMSVNTKTPDAISTQRDGATYYFCSMQCRKDFEANPRRYVTKNAPAMTARTRGPA